MYEILDFSHAYCMKNSILDMCLISWFRGISLFVSAVLVRSDVWMHVFICIWNCFEMGFQIIQTLNLIVGWTGFCWFGWRCCGGCGFFPRIHDILMSIEELDRFSFFCFWFLLIWAADQKWELDFDGASFRKVDVEPQCPTLHSGCFSPSGGFLPRMVAADHDLHMVPQLLAQPASRRGWLLWQWWRWWIWCQQCSWLASRYVWPWCWRKFL